MTRIVSMQHGLYRIGTFCLVVLNMWFSTVAGAEPLPATIDFAVQLSRLDTPLHNGQQDIHTTVKQLGIISFDLTQPVMQPGLAVGYAYVNSGDQPAIAGMEPAGFYIAPALRGVLFDGRRLGATLTATYLYQRVKDSRTGQAVTLEWQQPQLDLDVRCHLSHQVVVRLAGRYGRVDMDETLSGDVNQSLTLQSGPTLGYLAGLEFELGYDGQVGMLLHRAIGDGLEIYFQRQF